MFESRREILWRDDLDTSRGNDCSHDPVTFDPGTDDAAIGPPGCGGAARFTASRRQCLDGSPRRRVVGASAQEHGTFVPTGDFALP